MDGALRESGHFTTAQLEAPTEIQEAEAIDRVREATGGTLVYAKDLPPSTTSLLRDTLQAPLLVSLRQVCLRTETIILELSSHRGL